MCKTIFRRAYVVTRRSSRIATFACLLLLVLVTATKTWGQGRQLQLPNDPSGDEALGSDVPIIDASRFSRRVYGNRWQGQQDQQGQLGQQGQQSQQGQQDQEPGNLGQVPTAPQTGEAQQPIGPALGVRSNALRGPEPTSAWCNLGPRIQLLGRDRFGTQWGGWTQVGYHGRNNPLFNDRKGEANVHQTWFYAENPVDAGCCGWDFGFRVDGMYGIDAQDIQAFGNEPAGNPSGWDNSWDNGSYGFALPQAYLEIGGRGVSVKAGKFFSVFGYEQVAAPENFFYSHTYGDYFTQPFTHTGALATIQGRNGVEYVGGFSLGWETGFDQFADGANFIGGVRYFLSDCEAVSSFVSFGDTGYLNDGYLSSFVYERQVTQNLRYVLQTAWLDLDPLIEFNAAQYLLLGINDCLSFGTRLEWFKTNRFTGANNSTWDWTIGANYRPHANVVIRPEVRVDWGSAAVQSTGFRPIAGIDGIITF